MSSRLPSFLLCLASLTCPLHAADAPTEPIPRHESNVSIRNEVQLAIDKGLAHLASTQRADGTWGGPGVTGFTLMAFQRDPRRRFTAVESESPLRKGYDALIGQFETNSAKIENPAWNIPPAWLALKASGETKAGGALAKARAADRTPRPKEFEDAALGLVAFGRFQEIPNIHPLRSTPEHPMSGSALAAALFFRAGLEKPEPDVDAYARAAERLGEIYTLDRNPGGEGVHQYYFWLSQALAVMDLSELPLPDGRKVDVARQLSEKLINEQNGNGSWEGVGEHWSEKDPALVTSYCLLALEAVYGLL